MKDKAHDEVMAAYFRANPAYGQALLDELRKDGACDEIAVLFRQMRGVSDVDSSLTGIVCEKGTE